MKLVSVFVIVLSAGLAALAQEEPPAAPARVALYLPASPGVYSRVQNPIQAAYVQPRADLGSIGKPVERSGRRNFWLLFGVAAATLVGDCEYTKAKLSGGNGRELNPLLGAHPSRARIYAVGVPSLFAGTFVSLRLKKTGRPWWPVGLGLVAGTHGAALIHNSLQ